MALISFYGFEGEENLKGAIESDLSTLLAEATGELSVHLDSNDGIFLSGRVLESGSLVTRFEYSTVANSGKKVSYKEISDKYA